MNSPYSSVNPLIFVIESGMVPDKWFPLNILNHRWHQHLFHFNFWLRTIENLYVDNRCVYRESYINTERINQGVHQLREFHSLRNTNCSLTGALDWKDHPKWQEWSHWICYSQDLDFEGVSSWQDNQAAHQIGYCSVIPCMRRVYK